MAWELFVPGRLCLFGEHTDWAAAYAERVPSIPPGIALVTGTSQGLFATVSTLPAARVLQFQATWHKDDASATTVLAPASEWPLDAAVLDAEARAGGLLSYVAGTAAVVLERHPEVAAAGHGIRVHNHTTTLPVQKGLSSSAAVCVLVARSFSRAFGLKLTIAEEMELAFLGEVRTPSRCGRLDQACAFGTRPSVLEFIGRTITARQVAIRPRAAGGGTTEVATLHLVIVDLAAGKDTKEILQRLNDCYPVPSTPVQAAVHRYLGELSPALTRRALAAIEDADAATLGALMTEAQALFDRDVAPACPHELTAPVLHRLLHHAPLQPLVFGGKGVGSQGDGTAQLVARDAAAQAAAIALIERDFPGMHCLPLDLKSTAE